ncbi:MAG: hypothetical protein JWP01_2068 [Myxococcales bacterium]|nr:hypothetical protein [Myxococcales bacterium]
MLRHSFLLVVMLAACGEDEPSGPAPGAPGAPGAPAAAKSKAKPTKALVPKLKIEDRVTDAAEKLSIRHEFKDRDFAVEQSNRDPFQSFVVGQKGLTPTEGTTLPKDVTKKCLREDQFVASNYSYTDLRLVGIVAERAQRKVLMMDAGNLGHIIKKGDCVGREKAVVKDIGAGFITFQVQPEETATGQPRVVEEHSVQLYPNQMPVQSQPTPDDRVPTQAPMVSPSGNTPMQPLPGGAPTESP